MITTPPHTLTPTLTTIPFQRSRSVDQLGVQLSGSGLALAHLVRYYHSECQCHEWPEMTLPTDQFRLAQAYVHYVHHTPRCTSGLQRHTLGQCSDIYKWHVARSLLLREWSKDTLVPLSVRAGRPTQDTVMATCSAIFLTLQFRVTRESIPLGSVGSPAQEQDIALHKNVRIVLNSSEQGTGSPPIISVPLGDLCVLT